MNLEYTKYFKKKYKKFPDNIRSKVEERLLLLLSDEFNPILNNHKLNGKYKDSRSINVTGDLRIIFKKRSDYFLLEYIGTHSELYG